MPDGTTFRSYSYLVEEAHPRKRCFLVVGPFMGSSPNICRHAPSRSRGDRNHGEPCIRADHRELIRTICELARPTKCSFHPIVCCRPPKRAQLSRIVEWFQSRRDRRQLSAYVHDRIVGHSALGSRALCCRLQRVDAQRRVHRLHQRHIRAQTQPACRLDRNGGCDSHQDVRGISHRLHDIAHGVSRRTELV
ncbi:MAG: hypothetical protein QOG08_1362 [Chloroflexota bacterium]|nr:hypothetical protein [Chloroflexota bacterium]